jgi:hypothetical protein
MANWRSSVLLLALAGAGLAAIGLGATPAASAPSSGATRVLASGAVTQIPSPGVALTTPVDGRLRGPDFQAQVTGVAWPAAAGTSSSRYVAGSGQRLVVFALTLSQPVRDAGAAAPSGTSVTASVSPTASDPGASVDLTSVEQQILYATSETGSGSGTFVVAVPAHSPTATLTLAESTFAQSFDLWTLTRNAPFPAVLYRSPTSQTVTAAPTAGAVITVSNPASGNSGAANVSVQSAVLGAFSPDGTNATPPSTDSAYLIVTLQSLFPQLSSDPATNITFSQIPPLSGGSLAFTAPGSPPVTATATSPIAPAQQNQGAHDDGLLDATYTFIVPASTSSGTLSIAPGVISGVETDNSSPGQTVPLQINGPTDLALSFTPPLAATAPQPTPTWVTAPVPSATPGGSSTGSGSASGTHGGNPVLWIALTVVLAAVIVGAFIYRRRRAGVLTPRHREAPYRPLRPPALLAPAVPLALAAGPPTAASDVDGDQEPTSVVVEQAPTVAYGSGGAQVTAPVLAGSAADLSMVTDPLSRVGGSSVPVEVLVLGSVKVTGWAVAPRRNVVSALLCYLVHHPGRPVTGDQLHAALWPVGSGGREPSRATLHTYLSELRTALGPGVLPDATTTGGYGIAGGVVDDWSTFTSLATEAEDEADPDRASELRGQALSLVRGPPFAGATGTIFEWTTTEQHVATMEVAITRCAHAQVQWCLGRDDHQGAIETAEIGLLGVPDSYLLHGDLLASARALGDPAALRRATHQARRALGDVEADRLVAQLD